MSYSSLTQIPEFWRSANGLAVLASLGFHGLLLVVLPLLPLESQELELQRTIPVVGLTLEEQSRIPQALEQASVPYSAEQGTLPLPPTQAFQSDILPPLPPPPSVLPPPPSSTPIYQFPVSNSLPQPQTPSLQVPLPPPPQNDQSFISRYPFGRLPQSDRSLAARLRQPLPLPRAAIPSSRTLPSTSNLKPSKQFFPTTQPNNNARNQVATNQANQLTQPQVLSSNRSLPEKTKQELIARRNAMSQRLTNRIITPDDRSQRLLTLQQRLQQSRSSTNSAPLSNSDRSQRLSVLQQRLKQPQTSSSPQLSATTTQTIAQLEAFKQRQQKINQTSPEVKTKAPIRDKIKTCNKRLDRGVAVLAAVVSPEGKIISGPDFLSKPSTAIRQAAVAYVKRYSFSKTDNPTNQQFRLQFQYDSGSCAVTSKEKNP